MHNGYQMQHQQGPAQSGRQQHPHGQQVPSTSGHPRTMPSTQQSAPATGPPPAPEEQAAMDSQRVTKQLLDYVDRFRFPHITDVSLYERGDKIGQGTFGEVFKARCKRTGRQVALKKILMENEKEGFPITALREVKMLLQLKHENITDLIEVCSSKATPYNRSRSTFYLVFAFCEHDLAGLLSNQTIKLELVHKKTLMKHLFRGLDRMHAAKVFHRDMKAANVLLSRDGILKLADFGLARPFFKGNPPQLYTNRVVTLWYRPPELLLGERLYTTAIDIWGAGCIMAELWTRNPIMQGDTEQRQLLLISELCGSISKQAWAGVEALPLFGKMELPQNCPRKIAEKLGPRINNLKGMELLESCLSVDPTQRTNAEKALDHMFFFENPPARENVKDLMDKIDGSQFEYTAGRGAHAARGRQMAVAARTAAQARNRAIPPGQFHDMVF